MTELKEVKPVGRREFYYMDRLRGLTYQQIADKYGCSKQCVHKMLVGYVPRKHRRKRNNES